MSRAADIRWAAELVTLKELFPHTADTEIARITGRSYSWVRRQSRRLKLKKSAAYIQALRLTMIEQAAEAHRAQTAARAKTAPVELPKLSAQFPDDAGRAITVLPPTGPGYGPRIVHRISAQ